ncbi:hypothetical protein [Klebsiella variicola]|uniref:hypothetical protein n=1 Tax=Klebsiella variicola TaxID=244366 RepID=UPI00295F0F87|nr:hypothetical protein [Klebsiella variicola]MDW0348063.1 hypothetical protein [Klebsiella variicola]
MATTDTQQTAQFAAQAAVSAAEAKQYLLSIQQPVIDISESVADAQNAAAAAEMARDQAQGISTSLVQTIESQLSEQEAQFESQMTTQQSSFESSQSERASSFEEKSNEFESRFSSQLSTQESTFSESQTDKENRFQQFLLSSGYQFLGDYENGPYVFSKLNQYIEYSGNSYRIASASDIGFTTTGTDATSFANDVTHFVMMDGDTLRQNLGSGEGFKYIGQVRSAAELSLLPGSDGDRVLLYSYNAITAVEMPVGGGTFYYDSSLSAVNNGVTIFNGWCRVIENNKLTDFHAGCQRGDASDVGHKLANLFSVVTEGMTIEFHCYNYSSRNFVTTFKENLDIYAVNGGGINCWPFRDNFTFTFDPNFEAGNDGLTGSLGILSFYGCHGTKVHDIEIIGIQQILPQSNEWGDCAIRYENCQRFQTFGIFGRHFGAWGIFGGFGSHDSVSHHNNISDTHRQSGINIWANSNNCHAWGNHCHNNGLYNFECETFASYDFARITGGSCKLNFGTLAKINFAIVGVMKDMEVSGNTTSMGVGAIAAIGVKDTQSTRIKIAKNIIGPSWYGLTSNNCRNVSFIKNIGEYSEPDFLITDQYQAPVKLDATDPNSFYCTLPIAAGKIIKIVDSVYTVASYSSISAQELFGQPKYYKLDTFYKITLTTPIQPDFHTFANILFAWSTLNTTNGTHAMITNNPAFSQGNVVDGAENVEFIKNDMSGWKFGMTPQNTFSVLGGEQEFYLSNTLKCESWLRTGLALASRVSIAGNDSSMGTSMTAVVTGSDTTNWKPSKTIGKDGVAVTGAAPTRNYFRVDKTCFVIGYRVILRNWSATEDVKLVLANVNSPITITAAGSGTEKVVEVKTHLYALSAGNTYPMYLTTASNTLVAGWYSIEALILE